MGWFFIKGEFLWKCKRHPWVSFSTKSLVVGDDADIMYIEIAQSFVPRIGMNMNLDHRMHQVIEEKRVEEIRRRRQGQWHSNYHLHHSNVNGHHPMHHVIAKKKNGEIQRQHHDQWHSNYHHRYRHDPRLLNLMIPRVRWIRYIAKEIMSHLIPKTYNHRSHHHHHQSVICRIKSHHQYQITHQRHVTIYHQRSSRSLLMTWLTMPLHQYLQHQQPTFHHWQRNNHRHRTIKPRWKTNHHHDIVHH